MSETMMRLYVNHINNEAKFIKRLRGPYPKGLAEYDYTFNWLLERYIWVSTATTDKEYRERCERKRK